MDVQSVKIDLIHWLTQLQDKSVLKQLQGLKEQQESSFELDAGHKKELDSRLEKYENGEMEFSPWDKVKDRVRNSTKNRFPFPVLDVVNGNDIDVISLFNTTRHPKRWK